MLRLARAYVRDAAAAEEVVQETWLAVLRGIDHFEGRSSFKTWLYTILVNRARTRGKRDKRVIAFADLARDESADASELTESFDAEGHWSAFPVSWETSPSAAVERAELQQLARTAIDALPPAQRAVIVLRDIEGLASDVVCNILQISETNQRVLLHRARQRVRKALTQALGD